MRSVSQTGRQHITHSERGAVLIFAVVLIVGVLAIMVILGIDSVRIKRAAQDLRKEADSLCELIAENPMVQAKAVAKAEIEIGNIVSEGRIRGAELTWVRILIPTQRAGDLNGLTLDDYQDNLAENSPCINGNDTGAQGEIIAGPITLDCEINHPSAACVFVGDFCRMAGSGLNAEDVAFPASLVSNLEGAGNAVGCELRASVSSSMPFLSTLFTGAENIVARVMWRRPVRVLAGDGADTFANLPGLTIAISSHLTTNSSFPEVFRFQPQLYSGEFRKRFDPLQKFNGLDIAQTGGTPRRAFLSGSLAGNQASFNWYPLAGGGQTAAQNPLAVGSTQDELLLACMNPVVLFRNIFLSVITELAARSGQLRARTEILHANPVTRAAGGATSRPAVMVGFGEDLTEPQFTLPFVFFNSGNSDLPHFNGWINPLAGDAAHGFVSSQLRYCYSLYHGATPSLAASAPLPGVPGLYRFGNNIVDDEGYDFRYTNLLMNNGYEPALRYQRPSSLYNSGSAYADNLPWDQQCAWGQTGGGCPLPEALPTRRLSAGELVTALGSTQLCPVLGLGDQTNGCTADNRPVHPATSSADLRPDWNGILKFVKGEPAAGINSPGVYHFAGTDVDNPLVNTAYSSSLAGRTHILIVTHRPPLDIPEANAISAELPLADSVSDRLFTVAYFPTTQADAEDDAINRIRTAFNIPDPDAENYSFDPNANALFVFSPFDAKYNTDDPTNSEYPDFSQGTTAEKFSQYWRYMLGENPAEQREHIVEAAANIFLSRLLKYERRF